MTIVLPKPVSMIEIDSDLLEDDKDTPDAVCFSVILDATPSADWSHEFSYAYDIMHNPTKPPVAIKGDRIWISYLPRYGAELPRFFVFLKSVVDRANAEELRTARLQERDPDGHKARFREILKSIKLP